MDAPTTLDSALVIERLGGPSEVARLCECSPQAVSQWSGPDPVTQVTRQIPNSRLLFLKAIRADVFKQLASGTVEGTPPAINTLDSTAPQRRENVPAAGLKKPKVQALKPEAQDH